LSSGQDVEGDVQHVIGLVVRQVTLEKMETAVDVVNQSAFPGYQKHGTDAAAGQPLDPISQFVLDVAGGDHRALPFRAGSILDAFENSTLAFPKFVEEIRFHSKASVAWSSEDVLTPPLFQKLRGFSSLFSEFGRH
jgi:hypothetical protein